jgi:hypothetical protein
MPFGINLKNKNWRRIMKTTLTTVLSFVLFCSVTFAGDLGNGGYTGCTVNCPPPPCTENCGGRGTTRPGSETDPIDIVAEISAVLAYLGLSD